MLSAETFIQQAKKAGFSLYTGVPCSYLKPFINYVIDSPDLEYIGAANEGDAIAIASGAELAGKSSVVMFQNSGFGNTVNPLTSLNAIFKIPVLIITTLRGEPGGKPDEPQHELMGRITPGLFELMGIEWEYFPTEESEVPAVFERALQKMKSTRLPYALIMKHGSVADYELKSRPVHKSFAKNPLPAMRSSDDRPTRREALSSVQKVAQRNDILVATTGFTGRVLYTLDDRSNQLYMVGSMGCASVFGLGIARARPNHRVIALDGDGAALMRMSAMATLGYERPSNLIHIILDNEVHDSTGGQATVSHSIDFAEIAHGCGYPTVVRANSVSELEDAIQSASELTLIHVKVKPGESGQLGRPTITPVQVADRLRSFMKDPA